MMSPTGGVAVNLEYDQDEVALLEQAASVFENVEPIGGRERGPVRPHDSWCRLVDAGWLELGQSVEEGVLPVGLAVGVFRAAGRQLLIEQFLNGSYLLSALAARCMSPADRTDCAERLRQRPGVLLGDGRSAALPVVGIDQDEGYCFGVAHDVDVYRLTEGTEGGLVLSVWVGDFPTIEFIPALSSSVAHVRLVGNGWVDHPLDMDRTALARLETTAMLLHSAGLVGCAERLLDMTCDYVRTRVQFGAPIGSYQAVKHALADVYTANVVAWNAVLVAAAEGADEAKDPFVARYLAVECALGAARAGAQFHGGMGFTAELEVHRFLKAVLDGGQRFGSHDEVASRLGKEVVKRVC